MNNLIKVGMADLQVMSHPGVLTTLGLGSCVGVALYDPYTKIIGLAHIMLPSSENSRNNKNKAKFADTGISEVIKKMMEIGASKNAMEAKLAGGAQMFSFSSMSEIMRIGERNIIAARGKLSEMGIRIVSEDVGGNFGRTIELHSDSGKLLVKTIGHGKKEI